jgi:hypothetical protein
MALWSKEALNQRIKPFLDQGLIKKAPTWWQIRQGELQMLPYVSSTDATHEQFYKGTLLGHPIVRQPVLLARIGIDHLRLGCAFGAKVDSVIAHMHHTYHQGMPIFDLQVLQTHPEGLTRLKCRTDQLLENKSPWARWSNKLIAMIIAEPHKYVAQYAGPDGWIARAQNFEYPSAQSESVAFPQEFFSLIDFLNYCASAFPEKFSDISLRKLPAHLLHIFMRRQREGGHFGIARV